MFDIKIDVFSFVSGYFSESLVGQRHKIMTIRPAIFQKWSSLRSDPIISIISMIHTLLLNVKNDLWVIKTNNSTLIDSKIFFLIVLTTQRFVHQALIYRQVPIKWFTPLLDL